MRHKSIDRTDKGTRPNLGIRYHCVCCYTSNTLLTLFVHLSYLTRHICFKIPSSYNQIILIFFLLFLISWKKSIKVASPQVCVIRQNKAHSLSNIKLLLCYSTHECTCICIYPRPSHHHEHPYVK